MKAVCAVWRRCACRDAPNQLEKPYSVPPHSTVCTEPWTTCTKLSLDVCTNAGNVSRPLTTVCAAGLSDSVPVRHESVLLPSEHGANVGGVISGGVEVGVIACDRQKGTD